MQYNILAVDSSYAQFAIVSCMLQHLEPAPDRVDMLYTLIQKLTKPG